VSSDRPTITVNQEELPWHEGMTVQDVLDARKFVFPMLVVKVNGRLVRKPDYATTTVQPGDEIQVLHMISGG
jgi:thiamine biosynthesis protein ThiS